MTLPATNPRPPFNITRASHVVLTSKDLGASRAFYSDVLGFVVSAEDSEAIYLRGLEERSHHSIVLVKDDGPARCRQIGLRVATEEDLERAERHFEWLGHETKWVDAPYQGLTLQTRDCIGTPLELCAAIDEAPLQLQKFHQYRRASPMRLDHFQIVAQDVSSVTRFYADIGFRLTEFTAADGTDVLWGSWLARKGNPHDVVFSNGRGPRLHHFAFTVPETRDIIHACDAASSLGFASSLERGPGRHGIGNALFVYFRDPDGHRIELFIGHYQAIDDHQPLRWDLSNTRRSQLWGLPARSSWFFEATEFVDVVPSNSELSASPVTLEAFLASQV
jgi:catechol 2,3-dioxygenase